jgi:hypothetical protein
MVRSSCNHDRIIIVFTWLGPQRGGWLHRGPRYRRAGSPCRSPRIPCSLQSQYVTSASEVITLTSLNLIGHCWLEYLGASPQKLYLGLLPFLKSLMVQAMHILALAFLRGCPPFLI